MMRHAKKARVFLQDSERADWQDTALWSVRQKRDLAARSVTGWEQLREQASAIKENVLSHLEEYLLQFEKAATNNGVKVHWAVDARAFNETILQIIRKNKAGKIVKSKSMLTEECGLNPFLENHDIEIVDTDLGERIIQLRREPPSHIVLPAIHLKREEVGELFHKKLHTEKGNYDPAYLTAAARIHLRKKFLEAEIAITGVNFAVAENGAVVVCTNEGNADMGVHSAPVQIHCMGIEKIIPRTEDLGVFIRLLARSATGQPVTTYTSHHLRPKPGGQMHIVIVDNGRSEHLGKENFWQALKCIRCGACMNTCPVYRRSGGYSYGYTIPGPIGTILTPLIDLERYSDLPFACTLCGSCTDVCPVKINIHEQIYRWRQQVYERGYLSETKKAGLKIAGRILSKPNLYQKAGAMMRFLLKHAPRFIIYNRMNIWGKSRELPKPPPQTFKEWYKENHKKL